MVAARSTLEGHAWFGTTHLSIIWTDERIVGRERGLWGGGDGWTGSAALEEEEEVVVVVVADREVASASLETSRKRKRGEINFGLTNRQNRHVTKVEKEMLMEHFYSLWP